MEREKVATTPVSQVQPGKRIWVTWERQRRNETLSRSVNATLFQIEVRGSRLRRYLGSLAATLRIFLKEQPSVIFAQNPSIVLAAFSVLYGRLRRVRVVVDAHYAGVRPFEGKKAWANWITVMIIRLANTTIVTNNAHYRYVKEKGGCPVILPDPMPEISHKGGRSLRGDDNVLFICSWSSDEPYGQVINAAKLLPARTHVYITGNPRGKQKDFEPLPKNVTLTGYVSEQDYLNLIASCDVIIDLTTRDDCLVCGAYEAMAMGKAAILSGTEALRDYFGNAALYTDNSAADLASKIIEAIKKKKALMIAARELRDIKQQEWPQAKQRLEALLSTSNPG